MTGDDEIERARKAFDGDIIDKVAYLTGEDPEDLRRLSGEAADDYRNDPETRAWLESHNEVNDD